jgi:hypothetical protein
MMAFFRSSFRYHVNHGTSVITWVSCCSYAAHKKCSDLDLLSIDLIEQRILPLTLLLPQGFEVHLYPGVHTRSPEADLAQKINRYKINGESPSSRSDRQWEAGGAATAYQFEPGADQPVELAELFGILYCCGPGGGIS